MSLTGSQTIIPRKTRATRLMPVFFAAIALSDFLVFHHAPGLNLFLLSISLTAAVLLAAPKTVRPATVVGSLLISAVAAAPLIEAPTWTGFLLSMLAVICVALATARFLPKRYGAIPLVVLRYLPMMPAKLVQDARKHGASASGQTNIGATVKSLAGWVLPLGLGLVFLLLFREANPLIEMGLRAIDLTVLLRLFDISRLGFWLVAATFIWAMMRPRLMRKRLPRLAKKVPASGRISDMLDHVALVRSLCVFNILFALQTLLDLTYLWGGADLPSGMSHAEYAHRGAYPLVATALLAAVFVLIAMRRGGPGDRSPLIRALVMAWILQNVLLCVSSILRLDLYVETYSLTGLRIAAGIWMGLVAAGLVFILLRIALRRSNEWLISMNLATLLTVLYLVAFFDFSGFIARFNVENCMELGQPGAPLDIHYLASLGPSAIPALDLYVTAGASDRGNRPFASYVRNQLAHEFEARPSNWRNWSYRAYRMENYLRTATLIER